MYMYILQNQRSLLKEKRNYFNSKYRSFFIRDVQFVYVKFNDCDESVIMRLRLFKND